MDYPEIMRWKKSPDVIERTIEEEAVLLDLKSGVYYSLDRVGTWVWNQISEAVSEENLADALTSEYEVTAEQARQDLAELLSDLSKEGLIISIDRLGE